MELKLLCCLALCHLVYGRSQLKDDNDLDDAISNLQLLIPLLIQESIDQRNPNYPAPKAQESDIFPHQYPTGQSRYLVPKSLPSTAFNIQKAYSSDGPFSDIPSDAFQLQHRKELRDEQDRGRGKVAKKDLSEDAAPEPLLQRCIDYFRGRAQPKLSSLELILSVCTELLDDDGVGHFATDDTKQPLYHRGTDGDGTHRHKHLLLNGEVCECCPDGHHHHLGLDLGVGIEPAILGGKGDSEELDGSVIRADSLEDLLRLFKPVSGRREWTALNSGNSDSRLKQYVNTDKKPTLII